MDGYYLAATYCPDGTQFATACSDGTCRLWNAQFEPGLVFKGHKGPVHDIAWSPDGQLIASRDQENICVWRPDGSLVFQVPLDRGHRSALAWHPDSKRIAVGHLGELKLMDLTGKMTLIGKSDDDAAIARISWHPNGKSLVAGGWDRKARIWTVDTKAPEVLAGHTGWVNFVEWSSDGQHIASTSHDGTIRLWDPVTRETRWTAMPLSEGRAAVFDAAGNLLHGDRKVIEDELVYLVENDAGRLEVVRPSEFAKRIGAK